MIQSWQLFREFSGDQKLTKEIIYDYMMMFFHSYNLDTVVDFDRIDKVLSQYDVDKEDYSYSNRKDLYDMYKRIDILSNTKNIKVINAFIEADHKINKIMKGFPKFHQLEEIFLEFVDDNFEVDPTVRFPDNSNPGIAMHIELCSDWREPRHHSMKEYIDFVSRLNRSIEKIRSLSTKEVDLWHVEYSSGEMSGKIIIS